MKDLIWALFCFTLLCWTQMSNVLSYVMICLPLRVINQTVLLSGWWILLQFQQKTLMLFISSAIHHLCLLLMTNAVGLYNCIGHITSQATSSKYTILDNMDK